MQINLPDDATTALAERSLAGKSREEVEAMITTDFESAPATLLTEADWQRLHDRIDRQP